MSSKKGIIAAFLLAAAAGLLVSHSYHAPASSSAPAVPAQESVYDRVLSTRTMRCGYFVYAPWIIRDPNSGKLSGSFYDLTESLGKVLGLKIEWTLETTFTTFVEDMKSGRYDVFCGGLWPDNTTAPYFAYTNSVFYSPYFVYVKSDDHRFDDDIAKLNDPQYKFASIDGETTAIVKEQEFPKAGGPQLPNITDISLILLELTSGRADATAVSPDVANLYLKTHPDTIRPLNTTQPLRVFGNVWAVLNGEQKLINWLNAGVLEIQARGYVEPIVAEYHPAGSYLLPPKPYLLPTP
jgi:polar amino acid transport system substrate-binding protein